MRKSDKKLEKALRDSLTEVCEIALTSVNGFSWITHKVDFDRFPDSLRIISVFTTENELKKALMAKEDKFLQSLICEKLRAKGIVLKTPNKQISIDSEEACGAKANGDWALRFSRI